MKIKVIAVTMGDPGGIGPEVALKALKIIKRKSKYAFILFGSGAVLKKLKRQCSLSLSFRTLKDLHRRPRAPGIYFVDVSGPTKKFSASKITKSNAEIAFASLRSALYYVLTGHADALVTAPVNKTAMRLVYSKFTGHTEYLAEHSRAKAYAMMFLSERLKVTLVTIHVALKKVAALIHQKDVFEKIVLTNDFLKSRLGLKRPKIAVCALNPHGRETGSEDESQIRPAVKKANQKGIRASGPSSADQLFHEVYEGRYDAVVSMYHDQGLTPFKMIAFRDGVNVTLGLPFVRTSPDHGTAFDIAYQNKANPESMLSALKWAAKLVR